MALMTGAVSPTLYSVIPFDATRNCEFTFTYSGSQVFANKLTIRRNDTNAIIYDTKITSMKLSHILPANVLVNGTTYNATVITYDTNGDYSYDSNSIVFTCFTTPIVSFSNLSNNDVIRSESINLILSYSQAQNEPLNEYRIHLLDFGGNEIYNTGIRYVAKDGLTSSIVGFSDNKSYSMYADGKTLNGMEIRMIGVPFTVEYIRPDTFMPVTLENIPEEGSVKITSNFVLQEADEDVSNYTFIDGKMIDLSNGKKVTFSKGYNVPNDFTAQWDLKKPEDFTTLSIMKSGKYNITITWNKGDFEGYGNSCYAELIAEGSKLGTNTLRYILQSNLIPYPLESDYIDYFVRKKDGLFELIIKNLGGVI